MVKNTKVWTIIGTDGDDFINITAWDKTVDRLEREIGNDFCGKTFALKNVSAFDVNENFNYGSTKLEIRIRDGSMFVPIKSPEHIIKNADVNKFFLYQLSKQKINDFCPCTLSQIRHGEINM